MAISTVIRLAAGLPAAVGVHQAIADEASRHEVPADLSERSLHCFCLTAIRAPHAAIAADNNGVLAYRARDVKINTIQ